MQKMIAEWQIRDVIGRYARGVDRRDGKLIRECFHPGALTHFGDFDGKRRHVRATGAVVRGKLLMHHALHGDVDC